METPPKHRAAAEEHALDRRYRVLHATLAWVHFLNVVVAIALILAKNLSFSVHLLVYQFYRTDQTFVEWEIAAIHPLWLSACAPIASAIGHVLVNRARDPVAAAVTIRYIDYAISSPMMIVVIAVLVGLWDFLAIVLLACAQGALCIIGGAAKKSPPATARSLFAASGALHIVVWACIALLTYTGTPTKYTWVYGIIAVLFGLFSAFALVDCLHMCGAINAHKADIGFLILSATAKLYLQWTLYTGVVAMDNQLEARTPTLKDFWIVTAAVFAVSILLAIAVVVIARRFRVVE